MSNHTPEPWHNLANRVQGPDGRHIADMRGSSPIRANAQRAVACVNALAGLNPEAVPDVVAALREAVNWADGFTVCGVAPEYVKNARAALARLEQV